MPSHEEIGMEYGVASRAQSADSYSEEGSEQHESSRLLWLDELDIYVNVDLFPLTSDEKRTIAARRGTTEWSDR